MKPGQKIYRKGTHRSYIVVEPGYSPQEGRIPVRQLQIGGDGLLVQFGPTLHVDPRNFYTADVVSY